MFGRMLLLFIFLPMVELYLLIMLGSRIGAMPTIGLIVLTGVLVHPLPASRDYQFCQNPKGHIIGKPPTTELVEGALIVVGGIVLLTPGILTIFLDFPCLYHHFAKPFAKNLLLHSVNMWQGNRVCSFLQPILILPQRRR